MLTGKWPGIGISPKSALAALTSETVAFEKVQMEFWIVGKSSVRYGVPMARTAVFSAARSRILDNNFAVESGREAEFFWPRATVLVRAADGTTYTATTTRCARSAALNTRFDLAAAMRGST